MSQYDPICKPETWFATEITDDALFFFPISNHKNWW